jgi:hypothetical protein
VNAQVGCGAQPAAHREKAQNDGMHSDSLWVMLGVPALFCAPWAIAIAWIWRRTTADGDGTPAPSMGELARRRLNL